MTPDDLKRLRRITDDADTLHLIDEVERLQDLLKKSEWQDTRTGVVCVYCDETKEHSSRCPAFWPDGDVK